MPIEARMEGRENMERGFSLSIMTPFLEKYVDWDIVKCKPKSPYKSAFGKGV